ncbi:selenoprotein T2-like [Perca fluviatilis]|uniref:selenoprotein T2-like n=1 Tax=Perca fluviatilis TaxID=8168 RepID=UPI0019625865|nr:selenoprotein T2-like [Perca fluviatilis]
MDVSNAIPEVTVKCSQGIPPNQPAVSNIHIVRENYNSPNPLNRALGQLISCLKLVSILLIVSGQNPFHLLGVDTPRAWTWSQDNKIFSCLMAFFLCNMMETHFLSTGAFEVTLNDVPVWSKLQSGYVPNIQEIFQILDNQLKMNQVDPLSFSSP